MGVGGEVGLRISEQQVQVLRGPVEIDRPARDIELGQEDVGRRRNVVGRLAQRIAQIVVGRAVDDVEGDQQVLLRPDVQLETQTIGLGGRDLRERVVVIPLFVVQLQVPDLARAPA